MHAVDDDFEDRVRSLHEAPFTLASVRLRARAIRRRRRLRAFASAIALVVTVVPATAFVLHRDRQDTAITACDSVEDPVGARAATSSVGYASPKSAVRTRQDNGVLVELSRTSDRAQLIAISRAGDMSAL